MNVVIEEKSESVRCAIQSVLDWIIIQSSQYTTAAARVSEVGDEQMRQNQEKQSKVDSYLRVATTAGTTMTRIRKIGRAHV